MTHEEAEAELSAWLDGELEAARAKEVEALVATDAELSSLAEKLKASKVLLTSLSSPDAPPRLRANVLSAIDQPPWWKKWFTVPRVALAAVATLGVVVWLRPGVNVDEQNLLVAQNLELLEDYEVLSLRDAEDLEVISAMNELGEATP